MCVYCSGSIDHEFRVAYANHAHDYDNPSESSDVQYQTGAEDYAAVSSSKPFYNWDQAADQISRWDAKWDGGDFGSPGSATYSFSQSSTGNFFPVTASARAIAYEALRIISEVANLTFTQVAAGNGELEIAQYGTSQYGGGYGGWGGSTRFGDEATTITSGYANMGGESLSLFLHEIGHSIGLAHPGNYNGGGNSYAANAEFWNDSEQYSVMSYWSASNTGGNFSSQQVTNLMLYDIAALQKLYGANMSTRTGDTVYGFNATARKSTNNTIDDKWQLANASDDIVGSVWDAGGIDTLDLSGFSTDSEIDLRQEAFSSFGGLTNNFSIARGAVIENAIGGSGNDTISGNSSANVLSGGAGTDIIYGGAGADDLSAGAGGGSWQYLYGQGGNDTYRVSSQDGSVFISGTTGENATSGSSDQVVFSDVNLSDVTFSTFDHSGSSQADQGLGLDINWNAQGDTGLLRAGLLGQSIEAFRFADGGLIQDIEVTTSGRDVRIGDSNGELLFTGGGNDLVYALGGTDVIYGENGNDTIHGNKGDDRLIGGAGIDFLYGGANNDYLEGGAHSDWLYGSIGTDTVIGGAGNDKIYGGPNTDLMFGGTGSDEFLMLGFFGDNDVIADFVQGQDKVVLQSGVASSLSDVLQAATNVAGNSHIDFGTNQSFTINNVRPAELVAADFDFI